MSFNVPPEWHEPDFATTSRVAERLGWQRRRVWRAVRRGELASFQRAGACYLIDAQEAERFIAARYG